MKKTLSKEVIAFDDYQFQVQMDAYNKKLELEVIIKEQVKKLIGDFDFKTKDLFPNPEFKMFQLIEAAFADQNPMGLSGVKLAELKKIKVSPLLNNEMFDYGKRIHITKPTKAEHTSYAETDSELERLANCKKFIEAYYTFLNEDEFVNRPMMASLYAVTNGAITEGHNSTIIPNTKFVKNAL